MYERGQNISLLHLRSDSEFHPGKVVHLPVEPISEERMENVCLEHLQWDTHFIVINLKSRIYYCLHQNDHLSVEKLLSRLSALQEVFAVEDAMFVVQVSADVPVLDTGTYVTLTKALHLFHLVFNRVNPET